MKSSLALILFALLIFPNNSNAGKYTPYIVDLYREWRNPPPEPSIIEKACKPLSEAPVYSDQESSDVSCATKNVKNLVRKLHAFNLDSSNPSNCSRYATTLMSLNERVRKSTKVSDLAQIAGEATAIHIEITELLHSQWSELMSEMRAVHGTSGMAPGGLPCLQVRSAYSNYYDRLDYKAFDSLRSKAKDLVETIDDLVRNKKGIL